jgi:hypothetical protein
MEIDQNLQINLVSCLSKRLLYGTFLGMFFDLFTPIFSCKIQLFVTLKSDQDPDPYSHRSALVWLPGSGSALR